MSNLLSVTPDNIDDLTKEDILKLVKDKEGLPPKRNRLKIIEMVYEILGFSLSNDALLTLLAENNAQLCLATAGGGKTTFAQIKITLEKLWRKSKNNSKRSIEGNNILCLVYNKHNKKDMLEKQKDFIHKINSATPDSINLDSSINACTMHAFCKLWGNTYVLKMGLSNFNLITETHIEGMFNTAITVASKKCPIDTKCIPDVDGLIQLYNYHRETMLPLEDLINTDKYLDLGLPFQFIEMVFSIFNSLKKVKRVYDFTDMLKSFYDLISTDESALKNIQSYYEYIIADEVQDFTPIMWKILELLVSDGTPLLCIGDEDQNIYNFRGADIYNTLDFCDRFNDSAIYLLSRNRRCRSEILAAAKEVICKNKLRFNKSLKGVKDGGNVKLIPYNTQQGEYLSLLNTVLKMSERDLMSTVIAYREKDTSAIFLEYLANADIPFYTISGYKPFTHELYKHLTNILDLMEIPADSNCLLNLYKILPLKKADNYKILDYNPKTYQFGPKYVRNEFSKLDYGKFLSYRGFSSVLQDLVSISNNIETTPMKSYMPKLIYYFKTYFWDYKKKLNNNPTDDIFEDYIFNLFTCELTYPEFADKITHRKDTLIRYAEMQTGLAVSTFHGLKGLEFDTCFLINLDNEIFPNYPLIESKNYPNNVEVSLKEAERRLFYVAITRAKDNLILYYNSANPSLFMNDIFDAFPEKLTGSMSIYRKPSKAPLDKPQEEPLAKQEEPLDKPQEATLAKQEEPLDKPQEATLAKQEEPLVKQGAPLDKQGAPLDKMDAFSEFDFDDADGDIFTLNDDNELEVVNTLNKYATDKTDYEYDRSIDEKIARLDEEISEKIADVTNVEVGETIKKITNTKTVPVSVLPDINLNGLKSDELKSKEFESEESNTQNQETIKSFRSGDSYISRLFGNY